MAGTRYHRPLACVGHLAFALALPALAAAASPEAGLPFFQVFSPRVIGGHAQVWCAAEDSAEILYFGNFSRVLTYDGARWDTLRVPGTSFVRALAVDAQDRLWIGGVDELGYAAKDATGRRAFVSLKEKLPAAARACGEIWRIALTPRGPLFQSNEWLLRWDGAAFATLRLPAGVWQMWPARADEIWAVSAAHGWFRVHDDGALALEKLPLPAPAGPDTPRFALPDDTDGMLIGFPRGGLSHYDGHGGFSPRPTAADEAMRHGMLYRGARLRDGRSVIVTRQNGAFILDREGGLLAQLDEAAGLPSNVMLNVFLDRRGAIWLCTEGGIVRVDPRPWVSWFNAANGAPNGEISSPRRFHDELYFASDAGLARLQPATASRPARLVTTPELHELLYWMESAGDALLAGGPDHCYLWHGGEPTPFPFYLGNVLGFSPLARHPGQWYAFADGMLHLYRRDDRGAWYDEGAVPELANVRTLAEDGDGSWWMGTPNNGVRHATFSQLGPKGLADLRVETFGPADGLPVDHGWTRMIEAGGRPLLVCNRGFYRFDAHTRRWSPTAEFGARFADGSTGIRATESEPQGGLWIAAKNPQEVRIVAPVEIGLATAAQWRPLILPQLAAFDDIADLWREPGTDILWITATRGGAIRVDLAGWKTAAAAPPATIAVRRVTGAADRPLPLADGWKIPFTQRALMVEFAAPALADQTGVQYESTLSSDGQPLVQVDATPRREFAALAAGRYSLRLRARSTETGWGPPVTLAFVVASPWWFSAWAFGAYAALGSVGIAGLVMFRTRHLRAQAAALEAVVAKRTEELRERNTELARLHRLELDEKTAARLAEEQSRLELLRYQLNPHFLFNAFTTLRSIVFTRPEAAGDMVGRLADFCRLALTRDDTNGGTAADEAKLIETYLATEKARWRDDLACSVALDPAVGHVRLPPFLLQSLVENAVKYGGATSPGKLEVRVTIAPLATATSAGALRIEVANTGAWIPPGSQPDTASTGIGLNNLRQRLRRYYPDAHTLDLRSDAGWVHVELQLHQPARDPFAPTPPAHR